MTIKPDIAIARIYAAIIYADGFLSQQELEYLEYVLKPKYKISTWDFQQLSKCTFAQAIHAILAPQGRKWLDSCHQTILSLVEDMETLAKCDSQITPKEALICLCARLALKTEMCAIVSYQEENLRFSKSDIIYVESCYDASINEEIDKQYDNIQFILNNFGYNFIYIPKVCEKMIGYQDSYRKHLLQLLFPEEKHQEELDTMVLSRLSIASSVGFSEMLFDDFQPETDSYPSLLIKLPSAPSSSRDSKSDFALVKIQGSILETIQTFFIKYNSLTKRHFLQIQNGAPINMFQYRGFHRTFIEYLRNIVTDIQIHFKTKNVVRFGSLGEIHLPHRLLAAYLTILYFYIKQKPFCKDWRIVEEQFCIFKKIYTALQPYHSYEKEEFYTNMQVDYGKISNQYFGKLPNKCLQKMAPIYNRTAQTLSFSQLPPVQVILYSKVGHPTYIPFMDWVASLSES